MATSLTFESVARTHVGRVRELNEDAYIDRPLLGLWAVADGMGGHHAGEIASGLIAQVLSEVGPPSSGYSFLDEVRDRLESVNRTLVAKAATLEPGSVIGSTVVALLAYQGYFACLWAGDSRAYLLRQGIFRQVSRDHSVVQELIDSGKLSVEDAKHDKRSNVITRAIGVDNALVIDVVQGAIEPADIYILCSDGLTGFLDDHEIAAALQGLDLNAAADHLIEVTLQRGARDNVTLVIVQASRSPEDTNDQTAQVQTRVNWP